MKGLILAALVGAALLAALFGSLALATDIETLLQPTSVSVYWEKSEVLPDLTADYEANLTMRAVPFPTRYDPSYMTEDEDGHVVAVWVIGETPGTPGIYVPATKFVFDYAGVPFRTVDYSSLLEESDQRQIGLGFTYTVELTLGSNGQTHADINGTRKLVECVEAGKWCHVGTGSAVLPGIDIPECPGNRIVKPCNGCALQCED